MTNHADYLNEPETCAVYLRISLDRDGDEKAVSRQREDAKKVAQLRGWDVVEEYVDNGISASKAEVVRPEYERMLDDYRRGRFAAIICYDLDRLTRQPRQLEDWIEEAEKSGLVIVTLNGEADLGTDGGRMYARIKAAVARAEIDRKGARQQRAYQQRAESGHWHFSRRPYGYRRENGEVVVVMEEAEVVREGYRRYIAGDSYYQIASDWNRRGVPTIGTGGIPADRTEWSMTRVRAMLRNERYAGIVTYKGKLVELSEDVTPQWEPIIDRRTWDDYVTTRDARVRPHGWSNATKHLLSGLLVCGVCGERMIARPEYRKNPDGSRRTSMTYQCNVSWCVSIQADDVEPAVEAVILARLGDKEVLKALRTAPDTAPITDALAEVRARREGILDLLASRTISPREARRHLEPLGARIDELSKRLAALRMHSPLTDLALSRAMPKKWRSLSVLEKRRVIDELGIRVSVAKAKRGRRQLDQDGMPVSNLSRLSIEWLDSEAVAA